jgi:hypothetical protein
VLVSCHHLLFVKIPGDGGREDGIEGGRERWRER